MVEIRVLGPLQVFDGDGAIDITRPRERALLTMLAAQPGQVVSTDRLIEGLWGDSSPASATKTVQTYVHHLRSVLPADVIQTDGSGYRLAVDHGTVDWERFVDELDVARRSTDPEEAERRIMAALER